jgi:hypothetical protein
VTDPSIGKAAENPAKLNKLRYLDPLSPHALLFCRAHNFRDGASADYKLSGAGANLINRNAGVVTGKLFHPLPTTSSTAIGG